MLEKLLSGKMLCMHSADSGARICKVYYIVVYKVYLYEFSSLNLIKKL